jgi:hypothetical protein
MCILYSMITNQEAIRRMFNVVFDGAGNLPAFPGIYPDYAAPIVRNSPEGRELAMARWGMPSPASALEDKKSDPGATKMPNPRTGAAGWDGRIAAWCHSQASRSRTRSRMVVGRPSGSLTTRLARSLVSRASGCRSGHRHGR